MAERDPILSDEILAAEQEAIAATGGLLAVSPELLAAMQPPPPATGTPARTLAEELRIAIKRFANTSEPRHRPECRYDGADRGCTCGRDREYDAAWDRLEAIAAALRQPAPVAADGAGHTEGRVGILVTDYEGNRWLFDLYHTRFVAEPVAAGLQGSYQEVRVVRVRVTVLADDAGAASRAEAFEERMALQTINERDRAEDALADTHAALGGDGEWACRIPAPEPPDSGDLVRDVPALAAEVMARLAAAEAARAAAVTECRYLRAAISEAMAMVDEAYQATGYVKIAETSEQRQRLEALAAPAGGKA